MSFWTLNSKYSPLDEAPFIFPYFFEKEKINLFQNGKKIKIEFIEDVKLKMWGYCLFKTDDDGVIGVINFWTYFKQITKTQFICYTLPKSNNEIGEALADFYFFSTEHLIPIKNFVDKRNEMKSNNLPFIFEPEVKRMRITENLKIGVNSFEFPEEYKQIDEILIFATKENLYTNIPPEEYYAKYVLLSIRPLEGEIEIIPLDWFNKSGDDFGYVWPTRIARHKKNGNLHGQGVRMSNFILDPSGKNKIG